MDRLEDDLRRVLTDPRRSLPTDWVPLERVHRGAVRRRRRRAAAGAVVAAAVVGVAATLAVGPLESRSTGLPPASPVTSPVTPVTSAPAPAPTASTSPAPATPPSTAAVSPKSVFVEPLSLTSIGKGTFWVLGLSKGCTGPDCIALRRTETEGRAWNILTAPPATLARPGAEGPDTVSQVRFANLNDGWVYGGMLWATHDGAKSWAPVKLPGQVIRLEAGAGTAWALVTGNGGAVTLWRSPVSADSWKPVPLPHSLLNEATADLAVDGPRVIVSDNDGSPSLTWSTDGGATFTSRPSPCSPNLGSRLSASGGATWLVCGTGTSARIYPQALAAHPVAMDPSQLGGGALPNSVQVAARDGSTGVVALDNSGLYLVDISGHVLGSTPVTGQVLFVGFSSPGYGYAIVSQGTSSAVLITTDGIHWDSLGAPA